MAVAAIDFERVLASEGLAPIDRHQARARSAKLTDDAGIRIVRRQEVGDPARAEAVEAWAAWARDVLRGHGFDSDHQRAVWQQYAAGRTLTEIAGELFLSRRAVTRAIERVERWAPPAPVDNPWNKQHRPRWATDDHRREAEVRGLLLRTNRRVAVRVCMLALRCADKERLREIFGSDEDLLRLMPRDEGEAKETTMAEAKRVTFEYDRIMLKRDVEILRPRAGAKSRDRFLNVEGRPHAGGIDVEVETRGPDNRTPTITTVTLPWDIIAQADRSLVEKPAE